jgi:predicted DNA-binding antitoxin AbrB/MazE fold protein
MIVVPFCGTWEVTMARTLDAIFEDGVLKLLGDPGLQEHALVEIEIREKPQPRATRPRQRTFGSAKGLIRIADDFDEPLEDFREYM